MPHHHVHGSDACISLKLCKEARTIQEKQSSRCGPQSFCIAEHPLWQSYSPYCTWYPTCLLGQRSQTGIGRKRTVEAGQFSYVGTHRVQEAMSLQWRKTVFYTARVAVDGQRVSNLQTTATLLRRPLSAAQRGSDEPFTPSTPLVGSARRPLNVCVSASCHFLECRWSTRANRTRLCRAISVVTTAGRGQQRRHRDAHRGTHGTGRPGSRAGSGESCHSWISWPGSAWPLAQRSAIE